MYLFLQPTTCPNINISHYNYIVIAKGYKSFLMLSLTNITNLMAHQILTPSLQLPDLSSISEWNSYISRSKLHHDFLFYLKMLQYCHYFQFMGTLKLLQPISTLSWSTFQGLLWRLQMHFYYFISVIVLFVSRKTFVIIGVRKWLYNFDICSSIYKINVTMLFSHFCMLGWGLDVELNILSSDTRMW